MRLVTAGFGVRPEMHVCEVDPREEGFVRFDLASNEVPRSCLPPACRPRIRRTGETLVRTQPDLSGGSVTSDLGT